MGWTNSVLPVGRCFVPKVKLCGGLPGEPLLEALMTAIHYDGVDKRPLTGRLGYTQMAISPAEMTQRAEWMKGESLTSQEKEALERLYAQYSRNHVMCSPSFRRDSTMFTSQALAMKQAVFGWWFDIPKAVKNLEKKNAWKMDVERCEGVSFDLLCRALNKRCVPILEPHAKRRGAPAILLALGACSNAVGRYVVSVNPSECGLGWKSYFDRVNASSPEWGYILAPPGSAGWNTMQQDKGDMGPAELQLGLVEELPKGCSVLPFADGAWDLTVVKDMRPAWTSWQEAMERIVATHTAETNGMPSRLPAATSSDETRWDDHFRGKESFAIGGECDLIEKVRCCPAGQGVTPLAAALATVVFGTHADRLGMVESGYDWRRVVQFTCEERWAHMSEDERKAQRALFEGRFLRRETPYMDGIRLWSVDAAGEQRLRALFAGATNGVVLGPITPMEGVTVLQQAIRRLSPFEAEGDPVGVALAHLADRYGWAATLETTDRPSFDAVKKAVEMGIPVLLKKEDGGWVVAVGVLQDNGGDHVLVVEPERVKAEPIPAGASLAEHDIRMALSERLPGHVKYLEAAAKSLYVTDRLLDTRRELPEGCRFVNMRDASFAKAYFIHDWAPTICCKEQIRELISTTKPVQDVPDSLFLPRPKPGPNALTY